MIAVLALEGSPRIRDRIRAGVRVGGAHELLGPVRFASAWRDLRTLVGRFPCSPTFVDPFFPSGGTSLGAFLSFRRECPQCSVICYADLNTAQLWQLAETDVVFVERLDPGANDRLSAVGSAALRGTGNREVRALVECLKRATPVSTNTLLEFVFRETVTPCSVDQLARSLGISVRTLRRRCVASEVPPPKRLISLARIFHVERLAKWSGRPSGAVALALGFSDYANYRRSVRRELGQPPSVIVRRGGPDYVASVILGKITSPASTSAS